MNARSDRQGVTDDLDRLLSQALHAAVHNVRPPSCLAPNVCAVMVANGQVTASHRPSLWASLRHAFSYLSSAQAALYVPIRPLYAHGLPFVDLGEVSPQVVCWLDASATPRAWGRQYYRIAT